MFIVDRSAKAKGCVCLTLYGFIREAVEAQGRQTLILEELDVHHAVLAKKIECPFAARCDKYRAAVEKYGRDPYGIYGERPPQQLGFGATSGEKERALDVLGKRMAQQLNHAAVGKRLRNPDASEKRPPQQLNRDAVGKNKRKPPALKKRKRKPNAFGEHPTQQLSLF